MTFLPIILANIFIGIIQEWRSKVTLDKLTILSAPKIKVLRSGEEQIIPAEQLVLDDLVIFEAGNQIPADAVVEEGEVQVNEALITGEADEIAKKPGDELLSGSFIVSGHCKARLDKVGADSYVSKLTLQAKERKSGEEFGDDPVFGSTGQDCRCFDYSNWHTAVFPAVFYQRGDFPQQCDRNSGGCNRHDSGGTISACQCGNGGKCNAPGAE